MNFSKALRGDGAVAEAVAAFRRVGGGVSDGCVRGATAFFVPIVGGLALCR